MRGGATRATTLLARRGRDAAIFDTGRGPPAQALWIEETPLPEGVRLVETPGHSPYHVSFAIDTAARPVLVCGDALLLRGEETYEAPMMPPWSTERYRDSQARILAFDGV